MVEAKRKRQRAVKMFVCRVGWDGMEWWEDENGRSEIAGLSRGQVPLVGYKTEGKSGQDAATSLVSSGPGARETKNSRLFLSVSLN